MSPFAAGLRIDEPRMRIAEHDAVFALRAVLGQPVVSARARLRFGPGRTCESLARLLDRAIVQAEGAGLDPALLIVADGSARAAEDIVRMHRKGYGLADWISSPTCRVRIVLRPAGLHATAGPDLPEPPRAAVPAALSADALAEPEDERASAVRAALSDVIDPDLGVNIVDLGLVRAVAIEGQTAVITMTLTSPACPLTGVMESQIRAGLAVLGGIEDFRIDWQWVPPWRPTDITDSGREQLRAIGFSPLTRDAGQTSTTVLTSHGRSHPPSISSRSTSAAVIPQISMPLTRNAGRTIPLGRCIISRAGGSASSLTLIRSTAATSPGSTGATAHGCRHQASTGTTWNPVGGMNSSGRVPRTSTPLGSTPTSSAASRNAAATGPESTASMTPPGKPG